MSLEVVTVLSSSTEAAMLQENFIDRVIGVALTVLVRPGIQIPSSDSGSIYSVPIGDNGLVEKELQQYANRTHSRWLLQVDPDELWPEEAFRLAEQLTRTLEESEAAAFPMTYFVGSRPLRGGPWSGNYYQRLNSVSSLIRSPGDVHVGPPASRVEKVTLTVPIHHFWIRDVAQLRAKHDIYLGKEGTARITQFGHYESRKAAVQIARCVAGCIRSAPWKDGFLGIRLAGEMVRYQWKANAAWLQESKYRLDDRCLS